MCQRILPGGTLKIENSCIQNARLPIAHPVLNSHIMPAGKPRIEFLWIMALLFSTLACRAATRLVIPDTPTPAPTASLTPTATPSPPPTFTPTVVFEAACSPLLSEILNTYSTEVILDTERADQSFKEEDGIVLVTYEVSGDRITAPNDRPVPSDLESMQDDRAAHEEIWNYYVSIIPAEQRTHISGFFIFTDGEGNHLAAVSPTLEDPEQWILHVDILDAESYYELTYTLIHEQGHLLTLNAEQVPPSEPSSNIRITKHLPTGSCRLPTVFYGRRVQ